MCQGRNDKGCHFPFLVFIALLLISIGFRQANGQYAKVKRITAETNSGVRVTAWTRQQNAASSQEVIVFYE